MTYLSSFSFQKILIYANDVQLFKRVKTGDDVRNIQFDVGSTFEWARLNKI